MPRYAIVIADADLAHTQEIARNVAANLAHHVPADLPLETRLLRTKQVTAAVHARFGAARPVGTVHDVVDSTCPDGVPNCRNCGDPAHAASCAAAGHCPHCGRGGIGGHGLAPDSVLAANGYTLTPA